MEGASEDWSEQQRGAAAKEVSSSHAAAAEEWGGAPAYGCSRYIYIGREEGKKPLGWWRGAGEWLRRRGKWRELAGEGRWRATAVRNLKKWDWGKKKDGR